MSSQEKEGPSLTKLRKAAMLGHHFAHFGPHACVGELWEVIKEAFSCFDKQQRLAEQLVVKEPLLFP